jgi:hypothetical protein
LGYRIGTTLIGNYHTRHGKSCPKQRNRSYRLLEIFWEAPNGNKIKAQNPKHQAGKSKPTNKRRGR